MVESQELNVLVITGGWNVAIFTPEWVSKYLLPDSKLNVEIPLNPLSSFRVSSDNLRIHVSGGRLIFTLIEPKNIETLKKVSDLAYKIAEYLPHTPIVAFGINFTFQDDANAGTLEKIFHLDDTESISKIGYSIQESSIKRSFNYGGNDLLNFTLTKRDKTVVFDFNFHFPLTNLSELKGKLDEHKLLDLRQKSIDLIKNVYELKEAQNG